MGDILSLARKLERAMRNSTGFNVTSDEVTAIVAEDILEAIYAAKLRRLKAQCHEKAAPMSSATSGSTSGGTAKLPASGKSPDMPSNLDRSYIAALSDAA